MASSTNKDAAKTKADTPVADKTAPAGATDVRPKPGGPGAAPATATGTAPATPKRGPGAKEIIPFGWKLLGEANGVILSLFKAIEREDVESQLKRALGEGYYTNLRIVDNNEVIKQPSSAAAVRLGRASTRAVKAKAAPKTKAKAPSKAKKVAPKVSAVAKTVEKKKAVKSRPASKSAKAKKTAKPKAAAKATAKKKTAAPAKKTAAPAKKTAKPAKTAKKRTAKKK